MVSLQLQRQYSAATSAHLGRRESHLSLVSANLGKIEHPLQQNPSSAPHPFFQAVGLVAPDGLVYSNAKLQSSSLTKTFFIANPMTGAITQYSNRPGRHVNIGGLSFSHVQAVQYSLTGQGTRSEDGFGRGFTFGEGPNKLTVFINGRIGDSTLLRKPPASVTVNTGIFGSPAALKQIAASLPANGAGVKAIKQALNQALSVASAGGTLVGVCWRAGLQLNLKTGSLELNVSGFKIPLATFKADLETTNSPQARNHAAKSVARMNNEESYLKGANPFDHAINTRLKNGQFVNHGDPVAAIAGDVLVLQRELLGPNVQPLRSNEEARQVIELAITRRNLVSPRTAKQFRALNIDKAQVDTSTLSQVSQDRLSSLLQQLAKYRLFFGSRKIEAAATAFASQTTPVKPSSVEASFVRKVFEGHYRSAHISGYNAGDLSRDLFLANRYLGMAVTILEPTAVARDEDGLERGRNTLQGLQARLATQGGVLKLLHIRPPAGQSVSAYEMQVTKLLWRHLFNKLHHPDKAMPSAETLFQGFMRIDEKARMNIGRWITRQL